MLRVLDLFSGIGGFSLGLERTGGFTTVAFCEIEEFPRRVLAKHWPEVPIHQDVRKLTGEDVGAVDVICGGYPCQPFSTAGKRRGQEDDRHLWPEFSRLVAELRPTWVIGENVAGHISMGLDDVLSDLEGQGYACRTFVIPACAVGAHHRRDRCWTVAHSGDVLQPRELDAGTDSRAAGRGEGQHEQQGQASHGQRVWAELGAGGADVADTRERRRRGPQSGKVQQQGRTQAVGASEDVADASQLQRNGGGENRQPGQRQVSEPGERGGAQHLAHADSAGQPRQGRAEQSIGSTADGNREVHRSQHVCRWLPEPAVGRVANGIPNRVDRLKALGNAVVPQIPEMIGRAILEAEVAA